MNTIPAARTYPEARALTAVLVPEIQGKCQWINQLDVVPRSRLALAALLAGVSQELTRAELVALLADPVTRDQALAATPEGQLTRELTNSIYPQWEILREMLEEALAAPQVIVPMHDADSPVHHTFAGGGRHA